MRVFGMALIPEAKFSDERAVGKLAQPVRRSEIQCRAAIIAGAQWRCVDCAAQTAGSGLVVDFGPRARHGGDVAAHGALRRPPQPGPPDQRQAPLKPSRCRPSRPTTARRLVAARQQRLADQQAEYRPPVIAAATLTAVLRQALAQRRAGHIGQGVRADTHNAWPVATFPAILTGLEEIDPTTPRQKIADAAVLASVSARRALIRSTST